MPNLPRWTSETGRTILLGDSAHAMLPGGAQGVSQIIEDISVLSHLLLKLGDQWTQAKDVQDILSLLTKTWQDVRKPRFDRVKQFCEAFRTSLQAKPRDEENSNKDKNEEASGPASIGEPKTNPERLGNENRIKSGMDADFTSDEFGKWLLDHDVLEGLDAVWKKSLASSTFQKKT